MYCGDTITAFLLLTVFQYSTSFTDQWTLFGSKFYWFSNSGTDHTSAKSECSGLGAELVIIKTQTEFDFITSHILTHKPSGPLYRVAAERSTTSEDLKWADGSSVLPSFWLPGEPCQCDLCCIFKKIQDQYKLSSYKCVGARQYICMKEASQTNHANHTNSLPSCNKTIAKLETEVSTTTSSYCFAVSYEGLRRLQCAGLCMRKKDCSLFSFDKATGKCSLFKPNTGSCLVMVYETTHQYYKMKGLSFQHCIIGNNYS